MMKEWTILRYVVLLIMGISFLVLAIDPAVTISKVEQREGTKLVDIDYTVTDADIQEVTISVTAYDHAANVAVQIRTLIWESENDKTVTTGVQHRVTWDAGADWPDGNTEDMEFTVRADDGGTSLNGDYLVIDVSGGPSASSYPVSYLSAVPEGGWTDEYKTTKIVLRRIPAGTFTMGSPEDELGRSTSETQHQVTLTKDFYIGIFEATQKQWESVMGNNPSQYQGDTFPVELVSYDDLRGNSEGTGWPAHNRVDAGSFFGKLRSKTGIEFDLPTEAQWEYACRAGTTRAYNDFTKNNGEGSDCLTATNGVDANLDLLGIYRYNDPGHESNVGTQKANAWGLYDMHGNIHEWCVDWYGTYNAIPSTDPLGVSNGEHRVHRSGLWAIVAKDCRSASRFGYYPNKQIYFTGFRIFSPVPEM